MASASHGGKVPVAIIGMACRFPSAHGANQFWQLLRHGKDAIRELPDNRYELTPKHATHGGVASQWGGFLDNIDAFDASFFGIAPREAKRIDPQQRLLLETSWEALEDAGIVPSTLSGSRTGVFIGHAASDYLALLLDAGDLQFYSGLGTARSVAAGRISHAFDLRGPSLAVDTACSSSLVAVHLALQSIHSGESSLAIVGAANVLISPELNVMYSRGSLLAPDGRCKFGDVQADGFVRGEGAGVVVLKALPDALADGDPIRAVILGSATNNDGRSGRHLIAPAEPAQEDLLARAYQDAGVDPGRVDYLEAHGAGTAVGDPVEIGAAIRVLGQGRSPDTPLLLGSVKTNIGHTEAAAGMAGLIKIVLCLQNRTVVPSLHLDVPNPKIEWETSPGTICRQLTPLPDRGWPLVAGVTALGIAGTNAHVVVGEYVPAPAVPARAIGPGGEQAEPYLDQATYLLPMSAKDPDGLAALATRYARLLREADRDRVPLADLCRSAGERREHHENRLAVAGDSAAEIAETLTDFVAGGDPAGVRVGYRLGRVPPKVAFVFPGQGSQWTGMGRDLLACSPAFAAELAACDIAIRKEAGWSLLDKLLGDGLDVGGPDVIQPTLWAIQVSLAAHWRSWGVRPDWVIGHSMGEVAAAYVAGALSMENAVAIICRRSILTDRLRGRGGMALVGLPEEDAEHEIGRHRGRLAVAAANGPASTVLSGEREALEEIGDRLSRAGVLFSKISVDYASHCGQVDSILDELRSQLSDIRPSAGHTPLFSTVRCERVDGSELDAGYWASNLREKVRFTEAVGRVDEGATIFLEISPHPVLVSAVRDRLGAARPDRALYSLRKNEPGRDCLLATAGRLYAAGCALRWPELNGPCTSFVRLPSYPWRRDRFWLDRPRTAALVPAARAASLDEDMTAGSGIHRTAPGAPGAPAGPDEIEKSVRDRVAHVLDLPGRRVGPRTPLRSLGLDSVLAMEVHSHLERELGLDIPVATLLGDGTVRDIVAAIAGKPDSGGSLRYS
jgi:acyl transferase domain-containing protein